MTGLKCFTHNCCQSCGWRRYIQRSKHQLQAL